MGTLFDLARAQVLNALISFLRQSWRLCLLEAAPQDLIYSRLLQITTIATYFAMGTIISSIYQTWAMAAVMSSLDTALLTGFAYAALWVRDMPHRATQTSTALAASGTLLGAIALPLFITLHNAGGILNGSDALVSLALMAWQIVVVAHILRHALAVPFPAAAGISLVYAIVTYKIANILLPTTAG